MPLRPGLRLPSALAKRGMKPIAMPRSAPVACGISLVERQAPVAQLDRALDYEFRGREFEISPGAPVSSLILIQNFCAIF